MQLSNQSETGDRKTDGKILNASVQQHLMTHKEGQDECHVLSFTGQCEMGRG